MLILTIFRDFAAMAPHEAVGTLNELAALIRRTTAPAKAALPLLSPARYGDNRMAQGSLRHNGNVIGIHGACVDYNGEQVAFETVIARFTAARVRTVAYTTASHRPGAPRWRAVCPT